MNRPMGVQRHGRSMRAAPIRIGRAYRDDDVARGWLAADRWRSGSNGADALRCEQCECGRGQSLLPVASKPAGPEPGTSSFIWVMRHATTFVTLDWLTGRSVKSAYKLHRAWGGQMGLDFLRRDNELKDHSLIGDEHFDAEAPSVVYEKRPVTAPLHVCVAAGVETIESNASSGPNAPPRRRTIPRLTVDPSPN